VSESIGSRTAGSSDVGLFFLDDLERFAAADRSNSPAALRGALLQYLRAAQTLQPTLALVHQLAARALAVADAGLARGDPVAELRAQLARSCAAERADLEAGLQAVAIRPCAGRVGTCKGTSWKPFRRSSIGPSSSSSKRRET